jgi:hypothetical protein
LAQEHWVGLCAAHHDWVHRNPSEARAAGLIEGGRAWNTSTDSPPPVKPASIFALDRFSESEPQCIRLCVPGVDGGCAVHLEAKLRPEADVARLVHDIAARLNRGVVVEP